MSGFSPRNLQYMRKFAEAWPNRSIVQRTVAQLLWRSNLTLLDKLKEPDVRLWYVHKALELGMGKPGSGDGGTASFAIDAFRASPHPTSFAHYWNLIEDEIKSLVVDDKWLATFGAAIHGEMGRVSQLLTRRMTELAERYGNLMPAVVGRVDSLEANVNGHLQRMGF